MGYRKNIWYIIGAVLFILSALLMAVTMVFMYYGSNMAIVWFFAACPFMVAGWLIMQAVKQRYFDACLTDDDPVPMFWRIRYIWKVLQVVVAHKGLGKVIFASATGLAAAATLTFGVLWGYNVYSRSAVKSDPEFIKNTATYNEYYARWTDARDNGDNDLAHECFNVVEEINRKNYFYRQKIKEYGENAKTYGAVAVAFLSATGLMITVYMTYLRRKRKFEEI